MDSFFASIEMRERPQLKGQPLAVGGASARGVVCTCNYVARKFGVRSAMPGFMAKKLCPKLIFLPVRGNFYREESRKIRDIVQSHISLVEIASIDEMYFKVNQEAPRVYKICQAIQREIFQKRQLTASIGIAPFKMMAKIASDVNKPNGICLLRESQRESFMASLSLSKIPGVGPKAFSKLKAQGIENCAQMQKLSRDELLSSFGVWGLDLYDRCRGLDHRDLSMSRERKSFSIERTLKVNIEEEQKLVSVFSKLYLEFQERLKTSQKKTKTRFPIQKCFARLKFSNFQRITREKTCLAPSKDDFIELALEAFRTTQDSVRLIGMGVRFHGPSRARRNPRQLNLFHQENRM